MQPVQRRVPERRNHDNERPERFCLLLAALLVFAFALGFIMKANLGSNEMGFSGMRGLLHVVTLVTKVFASFEFGMTFMEPPNLRRRRGLQWYSIIFIGVLLIDWLQGLKLASFMAENICLVPTVAISGMIMQDYFALGDEARLLEQRLADNIPALAGQLQELREEPSEIRVRIAEIKSRHGIAINDLEGQKLPPPYDKMASKYHAVPHEFHCEILYQLMENPVALKIPVPARPSSSGSTVIHWVDKKYLQECAKNNNLINPFTKQWLGMAELLAMVSDEDSFKMRQNIVTWLKAFLAEADKVKQTDWLEAKARATPPAPVSHLVPQPSSSISINSTSVSSTTFFPN